MKDRKLHLENISKAMENVGFNQAALARSLAVSRETVSKWLSGSAMPRPEKLLQLSRTLHLKFHDLVLASAPVSPVIAFRTNKKKKITEEKTINAKDMAEVLSIISPYCKSSVFSPVFRQQPTLEYDYIQAVAHEVRVLLHPKDGVVDVDCILNLYADFTVVLIPVLWGINGDNGLYIHLPHQNMTFVYLNIEKPLVDVSFWALHELAHAMTKSMLSHDAETFADHLSAAVLFPKELARASYHEMDAIGSIAGKVQRINEIGLKHMISPFTVLGEMNKYAAHAQLVPIDVEIGGAATNLAKAIGLYRDKLFNDIPTAEEYVRVCTSTLNASIFPAITEYLHETGADVGIVQRLLNIPIADAKGVHKVLVNQKRNPS